MRNEDSDVAAGHQRRIRVLCGGRTEVLMPPVLHLEVAPHYGAPRYLGWDLGMCGALPLAAAFAPSEAALLVPVLG